MRASALAVLVALLAIGSPAAAKRLAVPVDAGPASAAADSDPELDDIAREMGQTVDGQALVDAGAGAGVAAAPTEAEPAADDALPPLDIDTGEVKPTWSAFVDNWELFRDSVYAAAIAGLVLGFLSVYVVLRRMVFVAAAVTQSAGLGVALSFYVAIHHGLDLEPTWGATILSLAVAALLAVDPKRLGLTREMVLGAMFAFGGGAAVLVAARITQEAHSIQDILFGSAVAVDAVDMHRLAISGAIVLALHVWWFRGMTFGSFDPLAARVQGLPVALLDVFLLISVGVMIGQTARALGALPAFALSTLPAIAALQLARGPLWVPFVAGALIGALAGVGGYLAAFFFGLPVGSAQTVLAALLVAAAVVIRLAARGIGRLRAGDAVRSS